ncbi:serine protease 42-like [Culicoides brevitarsis]|uniref:serine protease 42-like n=1 Tax=Culicoides brevitarsis TaxID=469753 RepID=UPI00307BB2E2
MSLVFCVFLTILIKNSESHFFPIHHRFGKFTRNPASHTFFSTGSFSSGSNHFFIGPTFPQSQHFDIKQPFSTDSRQEWGHESLSVNQCDFNIEDFRENRPKNPSVVCKWGQEIIIERHSRRKFWCIGYLPPAARRKMRNRRSKDVLTVKFDRGYRLGYSPGGMYVQSSRDLVENFHLDPNSLNKIIIKGSFRGFPDIENVEFNGNPICDHPVEGKKRSSELPVRHSSPQNICGTRQLYHSELISHGDEAKSGDWPFHASIFHTSIRTFQYKCGGTIISDTFILTAAHCVLEHGNLLIPERIKVHLGRHNLKVFDQNSQEFSVFRIICHENFNRETVRHDIALLKLSTSVIFTKFIQPACLPLENFDISDQVGTVIGFGRTEKGELSNVLREAKMKVPKTMACLDSNRDFYGLFLYDGNFCAGELDAKKAACSGDSGGGMYFKINDLWVVRGIVSVGMRNEEKEEGCSPDSYVLYTDIYKHLTWLLEKIQ